MTTYTHTEPEFFLENDACAIIQGAGVFDVEIEESFDADIGGTDGFDVVSVELVCVDMGGLKLSRTQLVDFDCEATIGAIEGRMVDQLSDDTAYMTQVAA